MTNHRQKEDLRTSCFSEKFRLSVAMTRTLSVTSLAVSGVVTDEDTKSEYSGDNSSKEASPTNSFSPSYFSMLQNLELLSQAANARVANQLESRSGKQKQRWAIDPLDGRHLRLVAGCIPILSDSRVILISSSSGSGWLVPKGGWEQDEELEEGAIRECFEEAGVLGILGPKLDSFRAETRKSRQRRLSHAKENSDSCADLPVTTFCDLSSLLPAYVIKPDTNQDSSAAEPKHTHVCMTFFPLYVQAIHDSWPENSRIRQAFSIDDAIEIIRPEFRSLLEKVKSLGLHLIGDDTAQQTVVPTI